MRKGKVINAFCHDYLMGLFHQELMPCWQPKEEAWGCRAVVQQSGCQAHGFLMVPSRALSIGGYQGSQLVTARSFPTNHSLIFS